MDPTTAFEPRAATMAEMLGDRRHMLEIRARTLAHARAAAEELRIASEVHDAWGRRMGPRWWFDPASAVQELEQALRELERIESRVRESLDLLDSRISRRTSD